MSCDVSLYIHCHLNNNLVIIIMYVAVCIVAFGYCWVTFHSIVSSRRPSLGRANPPVWISTSSHHGNWEGAGAGEGEEAAVNRMLYIYTVHSLITNFNKCVYTHYALVILYVVCLFKILKFLDFLYSFN